MINCLSTRGACNMLLFSTFNAGWTRNMNQYSLGHMHNLLTEFCFRTISPSSFLICDLLSVQHRWVKNIAVRNFLINSKQVLVKDNGNMNSFWTVQPLNLQSFIPHIKIYACLTHSRNTYHKYTNHVLKDKPFDNWVCIM